MKRMLLAVLLVSVLASCRKEEGLSDETGNLKITKPANFVGLPLWYELYSEEQFTLYLSNAYGVPFQSGSTKNGTLLLPGLLKGNYGIRFSYDGSHWQKWVTITPNNVTKITMP